MAMSGPASRTRRVLRSVLRKRGTGASPPWPCAVGGRGDGGTAAIEGEARASAKWPVEQTAEPRRRSLRWVSIALAGK
jgi:hypothetical protein